MRIRVPKSQLIRQLPQDIRAQVVSCNDLPDYFVFDVFNPEQSPRPTSKKEGTLVEQEGENYEAQKKDFPTVAAVLTGMEWFMFCVMLKNPHGASVHKLAGKLKHPEVNMSNNVSVHIKSLRRKLKKNGLAFRIETKRADVLSAGSYKLIREEA